VPPVAITSTSSGPQRSGTDLVGAVPELANYADITVEQFASVGSSAMTPDHWLRMAKRVNDAFRMDPSLAGVVITHGTDSMEETGFFLQLTVKDPRPVVIVGSMRASTAISADGPANLLAAVRTAVNPAARGKGVLVVLNDWIHSARNVRKEDSNRVDAFRSEWGPIGLVDSDQVIFRQQVLTRHTTNSEFDISRVDTLPAVGIASDFAGFDGSGMVEWAGRAKGLVLEAFAAGRTSPGATSTIPKVFERGVPVVVSSRVPEGRVLDKNPTNGVISARDLSTAKARVLLMLALTRTTDPKEIQRMFDTY
jgi:L-asparaginase